MAPKTLTSGIQPFLRLNNRELRKGNECSFSTSFYPSLIELTLEVVCVVVFLLLTYSLHLISFGYPLLKFNQTSETRLDTSYKIRHSGRLGSFKDLTCSRGTRHHPHQKEGKTNRCCQKDGYSSLPKIEKAYRTSRGKLLYIHPVKANQ